ncbi:MAG: twin-arginine translocase TatA/TatE family subunit [Deltaproteobacteria bacterium]|nr:MAG: twin-arginine translocase TatA/TatE family subunit [Deltaproteobacteria bacterium]
MHTIIGVGFFGGTELLLVFGITLVLFGGTKLPQLGQGLGEAIRNFKKGVDSVDQDAAEGAGEQAVAPSGQAQSQGTAEAKPAAQTPQEGKE